MKNLTRYLTIAMLIALSFPSYALLHLVGVPDSYILRNEYNYGGFSRYKIQQELIRQKGNKWYIDSVIYNKAYLSLHFGENDLVVIRSSDNNIGVMNALKNVIDTLSYRNDTLYFHVLNTGRLYKKGLCEKTSIQMALRDHMHRDFCNLYSEMYAKPSMCIITYGTPRNNQPMEFVGINLILPNFYSDELYKEYYDSCNILKIRAIPKMGYEKNCLVDNLSNEALEYYFHWYDKDKDLFPRGLRPQISFEIPFCYDYRNNSNEVRITYGKWIKL